MSRGPSAGGVVSPPARGIGRLPGVPGLLWGGGGDAQEGIEGIDKRGNLPQEEGAIGPGCSISQTAECVGLELELMASQTSPRGQDERTCFRGDGDLRRDHATRIKEIGSIIQEWKSTTPELHPTYKPWTHRFQGR